MTLLRKEAARDLGRASLAGGAVSAIILGESTLRSGPEKTVERMFDQSTFDVEWSVVFALLALFAAGATLALSPKDSPEEGTEGDVPARA